MEEIDKKIDKLLEYYHNNDQLLKITVNKLNTIIKDNKLMSEKILELNDIIKQQSSIITKMLEKPIVEKVVEKNVIQQPAEQKIKAPGQDTISNRLASLLDKSDNEQDDFLQYEAEPDKQVKEIKFNVTQKLVNKDNKPVFLASVSFFRDGVEIDKCKTKANGVFETKLPAGKYIVKINKKSADGNIESTQEIVVSGDTKLPMAIIR